MQVHQAAMIYLNDPKSGLTKKGSRANYRSELNKLDQHRELDSFTERDLVDACHTPCLKGERKGQRPSDGTIYSRRKVYEGFFKYAMFMDWIKKDPSLYLQRHLGGRGQPVKENNWLTREEVTDVLAAVDMDHIAGPRDNIFLRLGFTVGLRVSELANLRWRDINFDRREISLVGKGDKMAVVSITKNTFGYLMDWHGQCAVEIGRKPHNEMVIPRIKSVAEYNEETGSWLSERIQSIDWTGEPLSNTTLGRVCKHYSEKVGVKFAPHDMRRTFAGLLFEKVDIYQLKEAMRHSDVSVTERYLQTRPDGAAQAVRDAGLDF